MATRAYKSLTRHGGGGGGPIREKGGVLRHHTRTCTAQTDRLCSPTTRAAAGGGSRMGRTRGGGSHVATGGCTLGQEKGALYWCTIVVARYIVRRNSPINYTFILLIVSAVKKRE